MYFFIYYEPQNTAALLTNAEVMRAGWLMVGRAAIELDAKMAIIWHISDIDIYTLRQAKERYIAHKALLESLVW